MRLGLPAVFLTFGLGFALSISAQQPDTSTVQRDPQALAIIQQALTAMGGQAAIARIQTAIAQGAIAPSQGSDVRAGTFTWKDQFSPSGHKFRNEFLAGGDTDVFASGHGSPGWMHHGHVKSFTPHVANATVPIHLPAVILANVLANVNYSFALVGSADVKGQPATQVHLNIDVDAVQKTLGVQDWFFDPATGLPLRVEYRVPDTFDAFKFVQAAAEYSNFQVIQGVAYPFQMLGYEDGASRSIVTISSVTINPPILDSDFDLIGGAH